VRRYLVDTAVLAAYLYGRPAAVQLLSPWIRAREAGTSIVVYGEVFEHLKGRADFPLRHAQLRRLMREIAPHSLTYSTLERYADLRRALRPPHGAGLIGDMDTLIAATALERDMTVVTTDADFQRVPDLQVELISILSLKTQ
jgi:predicted nucleic acid-binding protein